MRTTELRKRLRKLGVTEVRQSGSHLVVRVGTCQTVVPVHNQDIPKGTLAAIVRDLTPCLGEGWLDR